MVTKRSPKRKVKKLPDLPIDQVIEPRVTSTPVMTSSRTRFIKILVMIIVLIVVVGFLVKRNKHLWLVASVNNDLITRNELNRKLTNRFGNQILEALIGERLISQEAIKQNITVSQEEINLKLAEIEKNLKGQMTLEESLKLQGVTRDEYTNQLRLQLMIEKILFQDVSVSAQEVDEFMQSNSDSLTASDPAERRQDAEKELQNNKIQQKFAEWFTNLKKNAQIERYL